MQGKVPFPNESLQVRACSVARHITSWSHVIQSLDSSFSHHVCLVFDISSVARESDTEIIRLAFLCNCHVTRPECLERKIFSSDRQGTPSSRMCVRNIPRGHARFSS